MIALGVRNWDPLFLGGIQKAEWLAQGSSTALVRGKLMGVPHPQGRDRVGKIG